MSAQLYGYRAQLIRVVDGDTVELAVDVGFYFSFRHLFRLVGINAPERDAAATAHLTLLLMTKTNWAIKGAWHVVQTTKADKYGRWLVTIPLLDGDSANTRLIADGFAVAYDGGKR